MLYDWGMKQGEPDSKKRIAFPILLPEGMAFAEKTVELHVVPTGKWDHPVYGEMEISSADIAEFVQNFKDKVRRDIPITAGHDNGMNGGELPAIGWFKELIDRGVKGLYAYVEWTEEGARLLREGAFKYFSPEFYETYSDPETGETPHNVLVGGALTNKPYFKELDAPVLAFSEPAIMNQFKESMDLKEILAKKAEELSADEKTFVREHKDELDADQQSAFASVLEDAKPEDKPEDTPEDKPEDKPQGGDTPPVEASEKGMIKVSASEFAALKAKADEGARAFAEVEAMKLITKVDTLIFSEKNTSGRILPKQKDAVVTFLKTLSEKQRDQFYNILGNLPKADASIFSEVGDGGGDLGTSQSVYKKISSLANEKIKASEGKLSFSDALKQVYKENPGIKKEYESALEAEN